MLQCIVCWRRKARPRCFRWQQNGITRLDMISYRIKANHSISSHIISCHIIVWYYHIIHNSISCYIMSCYILRFISDYIGLVGLVVKAFAPRVVPAFCRGIFPGRVIPVTSKLMLQWLPRQAPGAIRSALGLVGPVQYTLGEVKGFTCNFYLSVAARKLFWADPSLRYRHAAGILSNQQTTTKSDYILQYWNIIRCYLKHNQMLFYNIET